jgi:hypothetical protein
MGWLMTATELRLAGECIYTLKKLFNIFNICEGWRREGVTFTPRVVTETLPTGVAQGVGLTQTDLDMMMQGILAHEAR